MRRSMLFWVIIAIGLVVLAPPASAFNESAGQPWGSGSSLGLGDCANWACHGSPFSSQGPHSGFSNTLTDKCGACHNVHEAASSSKLLLASTITGVCNSCHDLSFTGAGGRGVYGAIRARGETVSARHDIVAYNETEAGYTPTSAIPGGDNLVLDAAGSPTALLCTSCHTPHANTATQNFRGDRYRNPLGGPFVAPLTNHLLQDDLQATAKGTYSEYGTLWCGACHTRRHSANPALNNHPTGNSAAWGYEDVTHTAGTGMGSTNAGYTMFPVAAGADGRVSNRQAPICQQCHEDYRDVEAAFTITDFADPDGSTLTDNPRFQTFPHETLGANMTVETGDDLCLNCHATDMLP